MGRTVSALVTWDEAYLGAIGPFPVSIPYWAEVESVAAHLREVLDVLDGVRVRDFLPEAKRPAAARTWIEAWRSELPGCDPARALAVAEPLAHLSYAVRYQEFLDGIEPSERIYHLGDPASSVRAALRSAVAR